jgi:hypothetical protein
MSVAVARPVRIRSERPEKPEIKQKADEEHKAARNFSR